jgi:hypothetical protein
VGDQPRRAVASACKVGKPRLALLARRHVLAQAVESAEVVMDLARASVARTANWLIVPTVVLMGRCVISLLHRICVRAAPCTWPKASA